MFVEFTQSDLTNHDTLYRAAQTVAHLKVQFGLLDVFFLIKKQTNKKKTITTQV